MVIVWLSRNNKLKISHNTIIMSSCAALLAKYRLRMNLKVGKQSSSLNEPKSSKEHDNQEKPKIEFILKKNRIKFDLFNIFEYNIVLKISGPEPLG